MEPPTFYENFQRSSKNLRKFFPIIGGAPAAETPLYTLCHS